MYHITVLLTRGIIIVFDVATQHLAWRGVVWFDGEQAECMEPTIAAENTKKALKALATDADQARHTMPPQHMQRCSALLRFRFSPVGSVRTMWCWLGFTSFNSTPLGGSETVWVSGCVCVRICVCVSRSARSYAALSVVRTMKDPPQAHSDHNPLFGCDANTAELRLSYAVLI